MINYIQIILASGIFGILFIAVRPNSVWLAALYRLVLLWGGLYGALIPIVALIAPASPALLFKEYYGTASLILAFFLVVFAVVCVDVFKNGAYQVNLNFSADATDSVVLFSIIIFLALFLSTKYQRDAHTMLVLPSLMAAYCVQRKGSSTWMRLICLHTTFLAVGSFNGFLLDSKERIVSSVLFPLAAAVAFQIREKSAKVPMVIGVAAIGVILLIFSSSVVRESRSQGEVSEVETFSDDRFQSVIERLAVIDALSSAVYNQEKMEPMRPTSPIWALTGFLGQVGPALLERPNHAREALLLTGYVTSNDDVNIALTVPGHFLWSLGWLGLIIGSFAFWYTTLLMLRSSVSFHPMSSAMFFFFLISQIPRLESVGYAFVASLITAYILYFITGVIIYHASQNRNIIK